MNRKLKLWEISLLVGILCSIITVSWLGQEQENLSNSVIRLHVIANSDSTDDQTVKLQVRDAVLAEIQTFYPENATLADAQTALSTHLEEIEIAGQQVVTEEGFPYSVQAELTQCYFPTKCYDHFALPAGNYPALRITLGDASGQNWWCVAFPPLCLGAATQTIEAATTAGLFTQDQAALMTEETQGYVLKFKSMELLGELREWLTP